MKQITKIIAVLLAATMCLPLMGCAQKDNKNTKVENAIYDVLNSTKADPSWAPTIGEMITEVFYNYNITWKPYNDSDSQYVVKISGDYNPNPNIQNLSMSGTITYLMDIKSDECRVWSDPDNISSTFLVYIVS